MIDKNFYLENLSAFDILIEDDREKAQEVIFRVYCILQRDKIWLQEVATAEEIMEEDAELLAEVEAELKNLDEEHDFKFDAFYQLVQQEMKKRQSTPKSVFKENEIEIKDNLDQEDDFNEEENADFDEEDFEDEDDDQSDALSHLSDEEIDLVPDFILESAKTRFNYDEFLESFPINDEFFVEEQFLFPIIAGKAFGEDDAEIAGKMISSFVSEGYEIAMDDLMMMIKKKGKELGLEILAFKIASDSLQQGAHPTSVIQQISQLLKR